MCGKTSFVFGLLIAIVVFSSASKGRLCIHAMGEEVHDIMKDFFTGNFNIRVADRTRLQKSAFVKFLRLQKGLSVDLEGNLLYDEKKSDVIRIVGKIFHQKQI